MPRIPKNWNLHEPRFDMLAAACGMNAVDIVCDLEDSRFMRVDVTTVRRWIRGVTEAHPAAIDRLKVISEWVSNAKRDENHYDRTMPRAAFELRLALHYRYLLSLYEAKQRKEDLAREAREAQTAAIEARYTQYEVEQARRWASFQNLQKDIAKISAGTWPS